MSTHYIGLKLGSIHTTIYKSGNGIVLKEASLIAMPTNPKNKDVYAVGDEAKMIKDRLPQNVIVYSPIVNSTIQYEELAIPMLKYFMKKVFPNRTIGQNIKALLCTPVGITPEERKSFEITCFKAGISDVVLIPDVLCYAVGNGIDIQSEKAYMIVNMGGNVSSIAIIANCSVLQGYNISIGGAMIASAIKKYILENYGIAITAEQAYQIKYEICSLFENYQATINIDGYNPTKNQTESITISSKELFPIIHYYYSKIAEVINSVIKSCSTQIINDIAENGIYYYGSLSDITGLDKFMQEKTSFESKTTINDQVHIIGLGELIKYPQLLHKIMKNL